jgi:hypothetical protein
VIELTYDKPYIGRRRTLKLSTKVSDISNIESKGHIQVRSVGTAVTLTGQGLDKLLHEQMFGTKS